MTSKEFVIWLKGFAAASNNYSITPKQWDFICEELEKVNNKSSTGGYTISIKDGMVGTTTTSEKRNGVTYKQDELTTNTVF